MYLKHFVAVLMIRDEFRVEARLTRELLHDIQVVVVDHDVDSELAFLAQLMSFLYEDLLPLALHFLKTSSLLVLSQCAPSHISIVCRSIK